MIEVDVSFPLPLCWPNGRTRNPRAKAAQVKRSREEAFWAAKEAIQKGTIDFDPFKPIPVHIEVHSQMYGPHADRDNCIGAAKGAIDGIAQALKLNDRLFAAPTVSFASPRNSRFVIRIGGDVGDL